MKEPYRSRERGDYLRSLPAFEEGRVACREGRDIDACPYDWQSAEAHDTYDAWFFGFDYEDGLDG